MAGEYKRCFDAAREDPRGFWGEAARDVHWYKPPQTILDDSQEPFIKWFPDGTTNACYNALDRHVETGRGDQTALLYDSPVTGVKASYSYAQLLTRVAEFAGALAGQGIVAGDRVIIYMPMVPEAAIAMLACARIGAVPNMMWAIRKHGCS